MLNKKGGIQDLLVIPIFIFITIVSLFVAHELYIEIVPELQEFTEFNSTTHQEIFQSTDSLLVSYDYIFLAILMAMTLGMIAVSITIPTSPIYFMIYIMLMVISVTISGALANGYYEFTRSAEFLAIKGSFPIADFIMNHFPLYVMAIIIIAAVVLYAKVQFEGGGMQR